MLHIDAHSRGSIATAERYTGWLSLCFAVTMIYGNSRNVLWKIAEHGLSRDAWAALFALSGLTLLMLPHWQNRRAHFAVAVAAAMGWGMFGLESYNVGAIGAAMIAVLAMGYMCWIAMLLFRG